MMEEHFMRSWNDGHDRFSGDIDRCLRFLGRILRRVTDRATRRGDGEAGPIAPPAAAGRTAERAVPARAAPTRVTRRR